MRLILSARLLIAANALFDVLAAAEIRQQPALEAINTAAQEFAPTFSADGKTMIFSSTRASGKGGFSHLYMSKLVDGKWSSPTPLHSVNSQFNDETPYLSADSKILLFASDRDGSIELPKDAQGRVRVSFDIYLAQWDGKTWSNPRPVQEINTPWNEKSPSLSRDGRYLFFSSWPFGDMQRSRIRVLDLKSSGNTIEDLPPHINSGNQETALVPGEDNTRYYFSSRRPGGKGGWDIWQTRFDKGVWAEPELLGGNVNTEGHEAFLAVSNGNYFISSTFNREKNDYDLNIEPIQEPKPAVVKKEEPKPPQKHWQVQLIDADTKEKIGGYVRLEVLEADSEKDAAYTAEQNGGANHAIELDAPKKVTSEEIVRLTGKSAGYLPSTEDTDVPTIEAGTYLLPLKKMQKNASLDIRSIYFDFDSARLKNSSVPTLKLILDFLKQNPKAEFEIIGHTDLKGTAEYNQALSEKRAESVRNWLVKNGVAENRLSVSGAGESRPVVARKGKPYDEQNRRTEFRMK
ncbi:OmpA family protein [Turneriella parva]|uniref:OmpA/MotB domain protein n=1 Tax=Turneriella parva (strain ATCC BAA-1111 / DSM 21527 / NCTC 11395 / H) TaxID=869212 RepID=I4BAZ7_TURPD|nr:OmpA family protein [Turneriella parva]AFM14454.1 OmpA/MotB domain protein [Turneriella parva DSM 21527]